MSRNWEKMWEGDKVWTEGDNKPVKYIYQEKPSFPTGQINPGLPEAPAMPTDKKYDQGKPMVGLVKEDFPLALLEIGKISKYGVDKYKVRGSWKHVDDAFLRYKDALGRHDLQSQYEDYDEESGHLHLAHMAWNALALLQFKLEEINGSNEQEERTQD